MLGLSPYEENDISRDTTELPLDAEVAKTDVRGCRRKGPLFAPALARQLAHTLMIISRTNGETVLFGDMASLVNQPEKAAIVDEGGEIYLSQ
ncbi:outer membrane usher protein psaC [Yersinia nurmii]|uniref:Outer membrane usher protein psaC n=1 Tax=Yersinia nurmii TaxID=685706 RepID=A0ABM9S4T1_9GAMM|nr:outer membrane usher protein psaC [Yersinia nurmii]